MNPFNNPTRRDFLKSAIAIPALAYVQDPKPPVNGDTVFADFETGTFDGWSKAPPLR